MYLQTTSTLLKSASALIVSGMLLIAVSALANDQAVIWNADDEDLQWGPCPEFMPESCGLAVLQGDPEARNADVFLRLRGNTAVAHHWHTSAERMVLVAGEMEVNYDGQDPVTLTAGTYAYGPARLPHSTYCRSEEDCVLFIAFEEPVDAIPTE